MDAPIDDEIIESFKVLTQQDVENDPSWKTAPIAVTSNDERHALNLMILQNFAFERNLPILKWSKDISIKNNGVLEGILHDEHPELTGYFVQGAPSILLDNLNPTSGLANGTPSFMHSLAFESEEQRQQVQNLISNTQSGEIVDIPIPYAIIITLPSIDRQKWKHESLDEDNVTIPLLYKSHQKNTIECGEQKVSYKSHMVKLSLTINSKDKLFKK